MTCSMKKWGGLPIILRRWWQDRVWVYIRPSIRHCTYHTYLANATGANNTSEILHHRGVSLSKKHTASFPSFLLVLQWLHIEHTVAISPSSCRRATMATQGWGKLHNRIMSCIPAAYVHRPFMHDLRDCLPCQSWYAVEVAYRKYRS